MIIVTLGRLDAVRVWDGEPFALDLGRSAKFVEQQEPIAVVWLLNATEDDAQKARAHPMTKAEGFSVFTFPATERDPIGATKKLLLERI